MTLLYLPGPLIPPLVLASVFFGYQVGWLARDLRLARRRRSRRSLAALSEANERLTTR